MPKGLTEKNKKNTTMSYDSENINSHNNEFDNHLITDEISNSVTFSNQIHSTEIIKTDNKNLKTNIEKIQSNNDLINTPTIDYPIEINTDNADEIIKLNKDIDYVLQRINALTNEDVKMVFKNKIYEAMINDKKGRFIVENISKEISTTSKINYKGRFQVTSGPHEEIITNKYDINSTHTIFQIIEIQSKQIDMLFDMIKNMSSGDKLFHNDFIKLSNKVYEIISNIKKIK